MGAFLKNIEAFRGTGENNEDGLSLEEFLEAYDADKYRKPSVTADVLVFSYEKERKDILSGLKLLMVKRRNHPSIGFWAIPGGFANMREDLIETAKRELWEETSLENLPLVQFYTYGEYARDPRDRVVTTAYLSMVEEGSCKEKAGDDAKDAAWWSVSVTAENDFETSEEEKNVQSTRYFLEMSCEREPLKLTATVVEYMNMDSLLKERTFEIQKNEGIAFDHARYIVMAYCYLKEKLK